MTKLPNGGNRIQCVEISNPANPLLLVSVYMPCKGLKGNTEEFVDFCLAQLTEIYLKYMNTHTLIIGGDFNEEMDTLNNSERRQSVDKFIQDSGLTRRKTGKAFVNPSGVEISALDYFLYPAHVDKKIVEVCRLEGIGTDVSDHLPMCCNLQTELSHAEQKAKET